MFQAQVFFGDWHGVAKGSCRVEALLNLKRMFPDKLRFALTFRPMDGMIYYNYSQVPCGVICLAETN